MELREQARFGTRLGAFSERMITVMILYFLIVFIVLAPVLAVFGVQQLVIIPRLRRELIELNARRAQRVLQALASSTESAWQQPAASPGYPFTGWIDLLPDGSVRVAGQILRPTNAFSITARDDNHIPRATATADGSGTVVIQSHGQAFVARYQAGAWETQSMPFLNQ